MIIHPYRGVQALFMLVPEELMPKHPLWMSKVGCPLERRWLKRGGADAEALNLILNKRLFQEWLNSGMSREQ